MEIEMTYKIFLKVLTNVTIISGYDFMNCKIVTFTDLERELDLKDGEIEWDYE